jgi:hypothetical protein
MSYWPASFSGKAILYASLVPVVISIFYPTYFIPIGLYIIGIFIIVSFFILLNYFTKKWSFLPFKVYERKLFRYSLIFRILFVLYMYLLVFILNPESYPFEINAADSWVYHNAAVVLAKTSFSDFFNTLPDLMKSRSDFGYPIYQGLIYKIFGPYTFPVRLINCLLGSYTVVLLSRISNMLFTEKHARLTGIIAMMFPSLLWFGAIQLKETLMIFMITSIFYNAIEIHVMRRIRYTRLVVMILLVLFLFYFRTFQAVLVIVSVMFYYGLHWLKKFTVRNLIMLSFFSIGVILLMNSRGLFYDVDAQVQDSAGFFERNLQGEADLLGNISFKQAVVAPFIIGGSFLTPFPSFLNTEPRQIAIIARFQNEMIRNLMYYFAILGLIIVVRKHLKEGSILIFFILSYLFVITSAANSFQDRFHLPMVPYIIIIMSVGFIESKAKWISRWDWYLIFLFITHLSWSVFKLNIRGI